MRIDLNGKWEFFDTTEKTVRVANVPSCNFLDLINCGALDDPFYGEREKTVKYVAERDWVYRRCFNFDIGVKGKSITNKGATDKCGTDISGTDNGGTKRCETHYDEILLVCDMLDTVCRLFLNGKEIGSAENCHVKHSFNIADALKNGENELEIVFKSPVNYVKDKYKKHGAPPNNNGQNGIVHIRKPQCHFGWDWGPVLPPSGISGNIYIECNNAAKITDLSVTQSHKEGKVTLDILAEFKKLSDACNISWTLEVTAPDGKVIDTKSGKTSETQKSKSENAQKGKIADAPNCISENVGECEVKSDFAAVKTALTIKNPELWWTRELSKNDKQPLYGVSLKLTQNDETVSEKALKIGLRTIELNRNADKFGNNFQFIINGVPIFAKGAAWIPADSFINRFDEAKLNSLLDAAEFSNMNMLRVWGGGYYESDMFYEKCDERGILVWQDFCFACQAYPFFDESFRNSVLSEVEYNVKRLRHHASLALWCGNNEIEAMSALWITMRKYVLWTKKFFYEILPENVKKFDSKTPYVEGSPCGAGFMKGVNADGVGDTHLWAVWHGLQSLDYYRKRMTRFCSEFGFESLPPIKTIESFAGESDYSLNSPVMTAHQKCNSGNGKMAYYICSKYKLPKRFEDYIYLSELCQQECVSDAAEHWRRNKGRCNGALYWQFNDCWPVCSWASIDYYGRYKALQYTSRHFFAPQSVSIENSKNKISVFVINDLSEGLSGSLNIRVLGFDGDTYFSKSLTCEIDAGNVKKLYEINTSELKKACATYVKEHEIPGEIGIKEREKLSETDIKEREIPGEIGIKEREISGEIGIKEREISGEIGIKEPRKPCDLRSAVVVCDLVQNGESINRKTCLFNAEKDVKLPCPKIEKSVIIKDGIAYITLTSDKFARKVALSHKTFDMHFSDNYFDLLAGESITITQQLGYITDANSKSDVAFASEYLENLEIKNMTDITDVEGVFTRFTTRAKVFLQPINFFSWLSYIFTAKPKK